MWNRSKIESILFTENCHKDAFQSNIGNIRRKPGLRSSMGRTLGRRLAIEGHPIFHRPVWSKMKGCITCRSEVRVMHVELQVVSRRKLEPGARTRSSNQERDRAAAPRTLREGQDWAVCKRRVMEGQEPQGLVWEGEGWRNNWYPMDFNKLSSSVARTVFLSYSTKCTSNNSASAQNRRGMNSGLCSLSLAHSAPKPRLLSAPPSLRLEKPSSINRQAAGLRHTGQEGVKLWEWPLLLIYFRSRSLSPSLPPPLSLSLSLSLPLQFVLSVF